MTIRFPLLVLSILACGAVREASAQRYAFQQIPWQLPADSVRALVQAQGFAFGSMIDGGDLEFRRQDGARLHAELRDGRLLGFTLIDPAPGAQVAERYRVVADSLQAALGTPDEVDEEDYEIRLWEAGLSSVRMSG